MNWLGSLKSTVVTVTTSTTVLISDLIDLIPDNLNKVVLLLTVIYVVWNIKKTQMEFKLRELEYKEEVKD